LVYRTARISGGEQKKVLGGGKKAHLWAYRKEPKYLENIDGKREEVIEINLGKGLRGESSGSHTGETSNRRGKGRRKSLHGKKRISLEGFMPGRKRRKKV